MSRRSRRQAGKRGFRWGAWMFILLVIVIVGFAGVSLWLRHFLQSEEFRQMVSSKVGEVLQVEGRFSRFRWDGFAVRADEYRGQGEAVIRQIEVDGLQGEVGLSRFWDGAWQVKSPRVRRLRLEIDARGGAQVVNEKPLPEVAVAAKSEKPGWLPKRVEMESLRLDDLELQVKTDSGEWAVDGVAVLADPNVARRYADLELVGGVLKTPYEELGDMRVEQVDLRCSEDRVYIKQARARFWERGTVDATGEWDVLSKALMLQGRVEGVSCDEVLKGDWVKRASGKLTTDYQVISQNGDLSVRGHLDVRDGVLTALPILDTLAAYTNIQRFRTLQFREAMTDWRWNKDEWLFNQIVLDSEGLVRVEGSLAIRGRDLDGRLRIGVVPGTLSTIPGAETHVFQPGERGMLWAPIRVTGTLDDPKEDLSDRLLMAAGARLFTMIPETGVKVLKFSGRELKDGADQVIDQGGNLLQEAGSLLEGLLGPRD